MGTPDRFSSMSVPERLSVDPDGRTRKNSDLSNASDNVQMTVPDKLLVSDMTHPYHTPHLDTPPKVLTMGHLKRSPRTHPNGTVSAPIPAPNFEQDDDIITLANRILALHQKVITLETKLNKETESSLLSNTLNIIKMFGIGFAAALLVQYLSRRR